MNRYPKYQHLCGETTIALFFSKAQRFTAFPLRVHYTLQPERDYSRFMVSVPKKLFKNAVHRNLLKRRIREAFRQNKPAVSVDLAVVYMDTEIATYQRIEQALLKAIEKINQKSAPQAWKNKPTYKF